MFGKRDKMDVRCHSDAEAARVSKNAHKESRESKGAEGNLPAAFLKEPQGAFSASGAAEDCNKSKSNSTADPDYCRRILVRGRNGSGLRGAFFRGDSGARAARRHRPRQAGWVCRLGLRRKLLALPVPGAASRWGVPPGTRALQELRSLQASRGAAGLAAGGAEGLCGRAQDPGCGLRPGKEAGNSGGPVRVLRTGDRKSVV